MELSKPGKKPKKGMSSNKFLDFDLLYLLSYMSSIAAADVPRDQIFARASRLACRPAKYIRRVELIRTRLGYDYATACRIVGEAAKEEEIKGLLLRFSSSLLSGEHEAIFLAREAEAQAKAYDNDYEGKVSTLKQWTDAYVSLSLAGVLVVIMGIVSTMIWPIEMAFILGLVMTAVLVSILGVWMLYIAVPKETVVLMWPGSREQKLIRALWVGLLPVAVVVFSVLLLGGVGPGWIILAGGALLLPIGFLGKRDGKKVARRDGEVGAFLRSLGGVCSAVGTTLKDGLGRLDLGAITFLRPEVRRLHARLLAGVRSDLCWQKFVSETGSEMASRSVSMFFDAVDMGGDPERAGYQSSLFATKIALLRSQRRIVSSSFSWLIILMHGANVVLLVFISQVIGIFGGLVIQAQEAMPNLSGGSMGNFTTFNMGGMDLLQALVIPLVLVFTLANGLAPSIVEGGSKAEALRTMGLTAGVTGMALLALPIMANSLFASIEM